MGGMLLGQLPVMDGVLQLGFKVLLAQLLFDLGGHAGHQGEGRHVFGDHCSSGDERPLSNGDAIENDGSDAN